MQTLNRIGLQILHAYAEQFFIDSDQKCVPQNIYHIENGQDSNTD